MDTMPKIIAKISNYSNPHESVWIPIQKNIAKISNYSNHHEAVWIPTRKYRYNQ